MDDAAGARDPTRAPRAARKNVALEGHSPRKTGSAADAVPRGAAVENTLIEERIGP
jgi:hypothetical protein